MQIPQAISYRLSIFSKKTLLTGFFIGLVGLGIGVPWQISRVQAQSEQEILESVPQNQQTILALILEFLRPLGLTISTSSNEIPDTSVNPPTPTPDAATVPSETKGFVGEYYHNLDLTDLALTRTDTAIDFDWQSNSPDETIEADTFSVRWTGRLTVPESAVYTFTTLSDDGVRLWVADQQLIDNWTDHPATENNGQIELEAGQTYPIRLEYFERYGLSQIRLSWSTPNMPEEVISFNQPTAIDPNQEETEGQQPPSQPDPQSPIQVGNFLQGGLGVGQGDGSEVGINLARFNQLKQQAETGAFDRACTDTEHDSTTWHTLVNPEAGCHYDHHHGDDPNYVNDIFGEPGAWFDQPGQSISYPWQTFTLPATTTRQEALGQTGTSATSENGLKHEGYNWVVRRNRPCENGGPCVTDFRVQFHGMFFSHGAATRWHSASIETRVCNDVTDPSSCGISREGGWFDFGILSNADTNSAHAAANESRFAGDIIRLGNENQFGSLDTQGLMDEVRHHPVLSSNQLAQAPSTTNGSGLAEWWGHGGLDSRFQLRVMNPIGNVIEASDGSLQTSFFCDMNQIDCDWNQSIFTLELDYVYNINSYFLNGDTMIADQPKGELYVNRFGQRNDGCSSVSLDCIPAIFENVTLNLPADGSTQPYWARYMDDGCSSCQLIDHDITPTGQPSWISWYHRYGH